MYQHVKRERIDPRQPYLPQHFGLIEQFVSVGGRKRRFLLYIPDGVRESCPGVLVLGGDGRTADDLARESGWRALADAQPEKSSLPFFWNRWTANGRLTSHMGSRKATPLMSTRSIWPLASVICAASMNPNFI